MVDIHKSSTTIGNYATSLSTTSMMTTPIKPSSACKEEEATTKKEETDAYTPPATNTKTSMLVSCASSPTSSSSCNDDEIDDGKATPIAVDPSPDKSFFFSTADDNANHKNNKKFILEGIPEELLLLGKKRNRSRKGPPQDSVVAAASQSQSQTQQQQQQQQQLQQQCCRYDYNYHLNDENESFESLLSSLDEEDELSHVLEEEEEEMEAEEKEAAVETTTTTTKAAAAEEEETASTTTTSTYYFTPLEEIPKDRLEKVKKELELRTELLQYLFVGKKKGGSGSGNSVPLPTEYVEQLAAQEKFVQQITIRMAQKKETERMKKRAERRQKRRLIQQQQQQQQQQQGTTSSTTTTTTTTIAEEEEEEEETQVVTPKLLFQQQQQHIPSTASGIQLLPSKATTTTGSLLIRPVLSLKSYWDFERYHGIPALVTLLLACVAHAALYELVLTIVLGCFIQPFFDPYYRQLRDIDDRLMDLGHRYIEDICYGVVLLIGLIIARCSGFLFSFIKKTTTTNHSSSSSNQQQQQLEQQHRFDRDWVGWFQYTRNGRRIKSCLDVLSFYLCFVSIMYFLGRFASLSALDQRTTLFWQMPSSSNNSSSTLLPRNNNILPNLIPTNHPDLPQNINNDNMLLPQQQQQQQQQPQQECKNHYYDNYDDHGTCPLQVEDILLPMEKDKIVRMLDDEVDGSDEDDDEDSDSDSSDDSDEDQEVSTTRVAEKTNFNNNNNNNKRWNLPSCDDIDDYGNKIIFESGIEDEAYLYERLSASAYHQFWGVGYRAAILNLPRQFLYNLTCSVLAIYALKRYFKCSFWEDL